MQTKQHNVIRIYYNPNINDYTTAYHRNRNCYIPIYKVRNLISDEIHSNKMTVIVSDIQNTIYNLTPKILDEAHVLF